MAAIIRALSIASEELLDAIGYYEQRQQGLGLRFWHEYAFCLSVIQYAPNMSQAYASGIRKAKLRHFPFQVVYWYDGDLILIIAVAHTARKPNYWIDRVKHSK